MARMVQSVKLLERWMLCADRLFHLHFRVSIMQKGIDVCH